MLTVLKENDTTKLMDLVEASDNSRPMSDPSSSHASAIAKGQLVVIDCGKNSATIYWPNSDRCDEVAAEEILNLADRLPEGSMLVGEAAHYAAERRKFSLAQPFSGDQLLDLYSRLEDKGIVLKLFPQKSSPRASGYANLPKSDPNDPKSIYMLLKAFPQISLMNPPTTFEPTPLVEEGWQWKEDTNGILNVARTYHDPNDPTPKGKKPYQDPDDANYVWIQENIEKIATQLSADAQSVFRIERYKSGNKNKGYQKGDVNLKKVRMSQFYTVLSTMRDYEGNLRKREKTEELPGWQFVKRRVLCFTPFHFKGGVARSNLVFWGARNWIKAQVEEEGLSLKGKTRGGYWNEDGDKVPGFTAEEDVAFCKYRIKYGNSVRQLFQVMKRMLQNDC